LAHQGGRRLERRKSEGRTNGTTNGRHREREKLIREEEEEQKRRSETERRGKQLREAWCQHHQGEQGEKEPAEQRQPDENREK
jgi:hypothetical protein